MSSLDIQHRQSGFTLLEVLLAVALFALVSTASFSMLQQSLLTQRVFEQQTQQLRQLQKAYVMLERDFSQAVKRTIRDEFGDSQSALLSDALDWGQSIELTVAGRRNPLAKPRSNLQRVRYFYDGENLVRRSWLQLDRDREPEYRDQLLVTELELWQIRFLVGGQWLLDLDSAIGDVTAIELELGLSNQQSLKWLFSLV